MCITSLTKGHFDNFNGTKEKKNTQKCARSMSFIWRKIESSYLTQRLLITCRYVMILTWSHFWRFKVTRRKSAKIVSGKKFSYRYYTEKHKHKVLTLHKYCLLPKGMPWFWPMVFWISSRPLIGNMQSLCLVCNSLLKKTLEVLLHIKIVIAVRMCFKLDPGSVVQVIVKSAFCLPRLYLEMDND